MSENIKIANLNTTESKQLMLINASVHYDNPKNVKRLYDHIEKKSFFKTKAGLVYKEALKRYIDGDNPSECIYCGQALQEDYYLICKACNDQLIKKSAESMDEPVLKEKNKNQLRISKGKSKNKGQSTTYTSSSIQIPKLVIWIGIVLLVLAIAVGIFFFFNKKKAESLDTGKQIALSTEAKLSNRSDKFDGFDLLGMKYEAVEPILGEAEDVVDASTKYFKSCGISVVYDISTGMVKYIDNDGTGDGSSQVPIFGILPGVDYEEARRVFAEKGIETVDFSDDSFMCMFQLNSDRNTTYEIDVTRNDKGYVALVAARIVY